jgi:hypothetical protein
VIRFGQNLEQSGLQTAQWRAEKQRRMRLSQAQKPAQ